MRQSRFTDEQLILTARLYFIDGLPQTQIGKLVNVSQSKISRMLTLARERGLVRVTVPDYEPRNPELEQSLKEQFGIDAVVIRTSPRLRAEELRQTVGYFAAPAVSSLIHSNQSVAIAGGRTLRMLVEHMKSHGDAKGVTVLQAMGNIDSSPGVNDAVELARHLAKAWSGSFFALNTPAILPNAGVCRQFLGLEQIKQVYHYLAKADMALVGIGTLENSIFVERRGLSPSDIATLRAAGAVGEILGRFYDEAGQECDSPFRERVISLPLDSLRRVPQVIAVVSGSDRSAAVAASIRGGVVKGLVIDEGGAASLIEESR